MTSSRLDHVQDLRRWLETERRGSLLQLTLGWKVTPGVGCKAHSLERCTETPILRGLDRGTPMYRKADLLLVEIHMEAALAEAANDLTETCLHLRLPLGRQVVVADEVEVARAEDRQTEEAQVDTSPEGNRQVAMAGQGRIVSKLLAVAVETLCCRSCCGAWLVYNRRRRSTFTGGRMQIERRVSR